MAELYALRQFEGTAEPAEDPLAADPASGTVRAVAGLVDFLALALEDQPAVVVADRDAVARDAGQLGLDDHLGVRFADVHRGRPERGAVRPAAGAVGVADRQIEERIGKETPERGVEEGQMGHVEFSLSVWREAV